MKKIVNILFLPAMFVALLLPSAVLVFAASMYPININDLTVEDTDHLNFFHRLPYDFMGNSLGFSYSPFNFEYGYGYGAVNGTKRYGYGYGYGHSFYAEEAFQVANNSTRLGFFVGNEAGDTYDSAVLPIDSGVAVVPTDVVLTSGDAEVRLQSETAITGPVSWDGNLNFTTYFDIDDVPNEYSGLDEVFNDENFLALTVSSGVNESLSLSEPAILVLPYEFNDSLNSVYFTSLEGDLDEINVCTEVEYSNSRDNFKFLLDNRSYNLDAEGDCYIYYDGKVIIATKHFSTFSVGEDITESRRSGGGGSGGSKANFETPEVALVNFLDLKNHWSLQYVNKLFTKGILAGRTPSMFAPNEFMNRAELAKVAYLVAGGDTQNLKLRPLYADVPVTEWYAPFVTGVLEKGIAKGYADGKFRPAEPITRAEALKMILEATNANLSVKNGPVFMDVPSDSWYYSYVKYAKENGIVSGYQDGLFYPNKPVTRAEVAKMVSIAMGL